VREFSALGTEMFTSDSNFAKFQLTTKYHEEQEDDVDHRREL